MFERFTYRAREVMKCANKEAQRFNCDHVGTEHILLGFVTGGCGVALTALKNLDVELERIRDEVEKSATSGPGQSSEAKLPQTPQAKKVIEYAIEEARLFERGYVGTGEMLLGLLRESEGFGGRILRNLGLDIDRLRDVVCTVWGVRKSL
jgi:ATP-dependent Clp protease ATP-binding subunit ClpC